MRAVSTGLDEARQFGRRFAGQPEPFQRQTVARIIDPEREAGQPDQRVDGGRRDAGKATEFRHRHQAVADILMDIAMVERGGRPDGAVRLTLLAGARNVAAVTRRCGGETGLMENVDERRGRNAERLGNGEAFGIDRRDDAADRFG